jgi:excisionase family DNA binding protein
VDAILPAQPDAGPREYLTPAQLADRLQVDRSTISRWAATDATMPVIRIHGVVRFRRDQLEAWLEAHTQGARRAQRRGRGAQASVIVDQHH